MGTMLNNILEKLLEFIKTSQTSGITALCRFLHRSTKFYIFEIISIGFRPINWKFIILIKTKYLNFSVYDCLLKGDTLRVQVMFSENSCVLLVNETHLGVTTNSF